ncbi:hypothetical protein CYFUS_008644 [Cystobacter fuscus]|uniref:Peroxidase n=1 Tax=Cystobacter fuscus TaxID=43 RepID=A0A250JGZ7_9BACT|nr:heme peroxidase family protein [Cystobacter fuscus]ATB43164.1 hypothetical protein CYFUS_008644 [Cystobacter fuscus]
MSEKSKPKGHAVLSGGCPFHRGTQVGPLPTRPVGNKVNVARNTVRRPTRFSGYPLGSDNGTDNGPTVTDFTRMFPSLPASVFDEDDIRSLTTPGGPMDELNAGSAPQDNPSIPAGFTFLGQFLDHDMTFDVYSNINQVGTDPDQTRNALTPTLDLGNVYGRGPVLDAFLYKKDGATLVYGTTQNPNYDVCRNPVGTAIIGDPRNDDNLFVSQIELAFIKFHNQVVKDLSGQYSGPDLFDAASQLVRWHYQWIVYYDFLPRFIGQSLFDKLVANGPQYYTQTSLEIPVEFSAAAYRMGHSTVRQTYRVNVEITQQQVFDAHMPGTFLPPGNRIDWRYFFNTDPNTQPQSCKLFDTFLASELLALPSAAIPGYEGFTNPGTQQPDPLYLSLAGRNLLRHNEYNLPAGQTIAKALGETQYTNSQLGLPPSWNSDVAPLWYYILKEARLANQGRFLGPVGGRIVGEVFFGILLNDPSSFLHNAGWKPTYGSNGSFTMADLLKISDAYTP